MTARNGIDRLGSEVEIAGADAEAGELVLGAAVSHLSLLAEQVLEHLHGIAKSFPVTDTECLLCGFQGRS